MSYYYIRHYFCHLFFIISYSMCHSASLSPHFPTLARAGGSVEWLEWNGLPLEWLKGGCVGLAEDEKRSLSIDTRILSVQQANVMLKVLSNCKEWDVSRYHFNSDGSDNNSSRAYFFYIVIWQTSEEFQELFRLFTTSSVGFYIAIHASRNSNPNANVFYVTPIWLLYVPVCENECHENKSFCYVTWMKFTVFA